tara:strand:+ start:213 stop:368 length:156 start_codon:yes stop_codon:yes gene_type:complete
MIIKMFILEVVVILLKENAIINIHVIMKIIKDIILNFINILGKIVVGIVGV